MKCFWLVSYPSNPGQAIQLSSLPQKRIHKKSLAVHKKLLAVDMKLFVVEKKSLAVLSIPYEVVSGC